ncbi:MAG TPA: hypothetical protein VFZ34_18480 [Blastocatellia bacterium]|nr:hypothetical protein [Blastocatellia bacterium]
MGRPRSEFELNQAGMILKFGGDLEAFLTDYAERHQFRSVQELLTMLVKQFIKQHADEAPARPTKKPNQPAKSRRINLKLTADLEAFLDAYTDAYDFTAKPELVKQIAREFYQPQRTNKRTA